MPGFRRLRLRRRKTLKKNLARFVLIFALSEVPIKLLGLNKLEYLNPAGLCSGEGLLTMALAHPAYRLKILQKTLLRS